ncbi:MAG: hypothetical protein WBJ00_05990, partial [Dethiobacteria bacterium]
SSRCCGFFAEAMMALKLGSLKGKEQGFLLLKHAATKSKFRGSFGGSTQLLSLPDFPKRVLVSVRNSGKLRSNSRGRVIPASFFILG